MLPSLSEAALRLRQHIARFVALGDEDWNLLLPHLRLVSLPKQAAGAIGLLTGNVVDRRQLYEQAAVLALVRFKNEALYGQ